MSHYHGVTSGLDPDPLDVTDSLDRTYVAGYVAGWDDSVVERARTPLLGYILVGLSAAIMAALITAAVAGLR